ncbi:Glycerol uptake facilitator protein [Salmonella enterica subsp. enterica serovar Wandsworth str. A4-580]|uniref:Glycerol uptake facilitator protein n=1 Tax=Salmonella enterica subsp. enterica serovar Wandsworth str. A4-580 TaxID=913086 RepID=G5SJI8_SALET|nr:Glycerol uptake facilitator protein [Salmonella enterica subsp. enterica serovar Wandsworth str. A4-580]
MSQTSTLKGQCIAEFLGTGLLIFFGVGCVAALKVAGVGCVAALKVLKLPELLLDSGKSASSGVWG